MYISDDCHLAGTELLLSEMPAISTNLLKHDDAAALAGGTGAGSVQVEPLADAKGVRQSEVES